MTADSGFLYQHSKNPYTTSLSISDTAQQQQRLYLALARLVAVGFVVDTDGQRLRVSPAALLTAAQREWIQTHKAALVAAVSAPCCRWCIEYPRSAVTPDSGTRLVSDYWPAVDWRRVSSEYPGSAVWPAPDNLDVAGWIDAGMPSTAPPEATRGHQQRGID